MRDGWADTSIGDIAAINPERTPEWPASHRIRYVDLSSVSAESGIRREAVSEISFGDAPGRARRVVRAGDVLVATVRPYLRGFAHVPPWLDGEVASTGFAVLRARESVVLAEFLWCIVRTDGFVNGLMERATGSNYPAVRPEDVAAQNIVLPPLAEQRRIVDLIGTADEVAVMASETGRRATKLRNAFLSTLMSGEHDIPASYDRFVDISE